MQKRLYSARRISVTEKPGRLSGFSSLQSCASQPDQNETDEPPSLFESLNAGIGLYGLSRINTRPFRFVNLRSLLFLSKSHMPKERKDPFFAGSADQLTTEFLCSRISLQQAADCWELQEEGFIVRDKTGRIKTIIFCKKRST